MRCIDADCCYKCYTDEVYVSACVVHHHKLCKNGLTDRNAVFAGKIVRELLLEKGPANPNGRGNFFRDWHVPVSWKTWIFYCTCTQRANYDQASVTQFFRLSCRFQALTAMWPVVKLLGTLLFFYDHFTRWRRLYFYDSLISIKETGSCMRSIKLRHCLWSWVTSTTPNHSNFYVFGFLLYLWNEWF